MNFFLALIGILIFPIGFMMIIYALFEIVDEQRRQTELLEYEIDEYDRRTGGTHLAR